MINYFDLLVCGLFGYVVAETTPAFRSWQFWTLNALFVIHGVLVIKL